jgi:hypothetical protein
LAISAVLTAACGSAEPLEESAVLVEKSAVQVEESVAPAEEPEPLVNEIDGEGLAVPGEPVVMWFWSPD